MTGDPATRFSARLRAETRSAHQVAERAGALDLLGRGGGGVALYRRLLVQSHFVHVALDEVARELADDPVVTQFLDPVLDRLPLLHADLADIAGTSWADDSWPLPTTADYVARIREVGAGSSTAFVAHHYTRHLGDLSGGVAVAAAVRDSLGVETRFLGFPGVDVEAAKTRYRRRLDAAAWSDTERARMVAEVLVAYELNTAQQQELAAADPVTC